MIDELTIDILRDALTLSLAGGVMRVLFPPKELLLRKVIEIIASAVFVGCLVTFYTADTLTDEQQGIRMCAVMLGAYLGTNLLQFIINNFDAIMKRRIKK